MPMSSLFIALSALLILAGMAGTLYRFCQAAIDAGRFGAAGRGSAAMAMLASALFAWFY